MLRIQTLETVWLPVEWQLTEVWREARTTLSADFVLLQVPQCHLRLKLARHERTICTTSCTTLGRVCLLATAMCAGSAEQRCISAIAAAYPASGKTGPSAAL
ncbi:unnamed protein product [Symbiodinium sp. CCMP2456]|nr:unnamed protein product [Symbiodinium sp. CCMP2456]